MRHLGSELCAASASSAIGGATLGTALVIAGHSRHEFLPVTGLLLLGEGISSTSPQDGWDQTVMGDHDIAVLSP